MPVEKIEKNNLKKGLRPWLGVLIYTHREAQRLKEKRND